MKRTIKTLLDHYLPDLLPGMVCFWLLFAFITPLSAQFAGGNGSENNPYLIANVTQLQAISTVSNSAHFKLINDIDASATATWNSGQGFNPIEYINGTIDGNNFTVTNLSINRSALKNCGFIRTTGAMAVIQNITFVNATVKGEDRTGMFVGTLGGTISNVTGSGTVQGGSNVGGFAGRIDAGASVLNSSMSVNVSGTGDHVGGITGLLNSNAILTNVSNTGNVSGQSYVGGVTGQANSNSIVTNAVINGNVTGAGDYVAGLVGYNQNQIIGGSYTGTVTGRDYVGGAVGKNEGSVSGVTINGNVNASRDFAGGLIGMNNNGDIANCSTSGSVSGEKNIGGLVGHHAYSNGTITECNSSMSVNGDENVGGLVGRNQDGLIEKSYSTGPVNGTTAVGGLVGISQWGSSLIRYCFSSSDVTPASGGNNNQFGGLVGILIGGSVQNSFAQGSVTGNNYVGGLVGELNDGASVVNSYSTALVNGSGGLTGGLIGRSQKSSVSDSYWDTQTSGQSSSAGGLGRTSAQMLDQSLYTSVGWDFSTIWSMDASTNNGYPYLIPLAGAFQFVWTGNIDTEWEKTGNWSLNRLPTSTDNIIITNVFNKPILGSDAMVKGISVQPNSTLTISPAGALRVLQTLTNNAGNAGIIIVSDTNGTGSLIHPSPNIQATFQRYIPGAPEAWHSISSPMMAQAIAPAFTPTGTYGDSTGYDLYHWHEPDTSWIYYNHPAVWNTTHGSLNFKPGQGYLVAYQDTNPTKTFAGMLNQGSVSIPVTKTTGVADEFGFNLVGNPYASSIDWKAASGWTRSPLEQSAGGYNLWIWNDTAFNYGVYNSASVMDVGTLGTGRFISPTQGFFIRAAQSGTLSFSDDIRVHTNSGHWLKTTHGHGDEDAMVTLTLRAAKPLQGSDEVQVLFGYPEEGGSQKRFSFVPKAPSLFIPNASVAWTVRMLESTDRHPVIPISFIPPAEGKYTLAASFDPLSFQTIVLEDLKTGTTHNLKTQSEVTFFAIQDDDPARFVLRFKEGVFPNPHEELPVHIFSNQRTLTVDLRLLTIGQTYTLNIITMDGKLAGFHSLNGGNLVKLNMHELPAGIYLISVAGTEGIKRVKVCL